MEPLFDELNAPWQLYVPQTIGARDCSLVTCLGLFYSWKEQIDIRNDQRTSCADAEVEQVVETIRRKTSTQDEEGGFTKKLKSILLNDR